MVLGDLLTLGASDQGWCCITTTVPLVPQDHLGSWLWCTGLLREDPPTLLVYNLHVSDMDAGGWGAKRNACLQALLEEATQLLGLGQAARRIFTVHGDEVHSVHELQDLQELVITTGAPFSHLAKRWVPR